MALRFLVLLILASCAGSLREQTIAISNGAADVIDIGTNALLRTYCAESMATIGRTGTLTSDGHCRETGPRMGTPATEIEASALSVLRVRWEPVLTAANATTHSHDALRGLLAGGLAVTDGQILVAVGELATSYESLRQAATVVGLTPPPALVLGGVR